MLSAVGLSLGATDSAGDKDMSDIASLMELTQGGFASIPKEFFSGKTVA